MDFYVDEKERKKRRQWLKVKIYGGFIIFFALILGAAHLILYSSLFEVKNFEVSGNQNVKSEEIINALKNTAVMKSKLAALLGPDNILSWKSDDLKSITNVFPQISDIKIENNYLSRQVKIAIQEREKFGVWCLINQQSTTSSDESTVNIQQSVNKCFWFDKNGVLFSDALYTQGNLINRVNDFSGRSLKLGDLALKEIFWENLVKIFYVLDKSGLEIKSLTLKNLQDQEIVAESENGSLPKIYFSLKFDPGFGLAAIESLKNTGLDKLEYIDLRVENRAYYKTK